MITVSFCLRCSRIEWTNVSVVEQALNETFPDQTLLMNGLIMGFKGFLSFLSAPFIGALSDQWGRKYLLLITVMFTCFPIPVMVMNRYIFFILCSLSGLFAVTFSVVFAYVADVTTDEDRSSSYGLVSATFAASYITSPALGAYVSQSYGDIAVVLLATLISLLDISFIWFFLPESLSEKKLLRMKRDSIKTSIWQTSNPFASLQKVGRDPMIMMLCIAVFLSYLPEAGEYSCFFVYLRLVIGFSAEDVALFIAVVGLLSVVAQTVIMSCFMNLFSARNTIIIGLVFEASQLLLYGFATSYRVIWLAGILAAFASITFPAISAYVSTHADVDQQGVVQGMVTGVRGLCNGLGPALFGFIFGLFHVDLTHEGLSHPSLPSTSRILSPSVQNGHVIHLHQTPSSSNSSTESHQVTETSIVPGPPFVFGSLMVILAMVVTTLIPQVVHYRALKTKDSPLRDPSSPLNAHSSSPSNSNQTTTKGSFSRYHYSDVEVDGNESTGYHKERSHHEIEAGDEEDEEDTFGYSSSSSPTPSIEVEPRHRAKSTCELNMPLIDDKEEPL
jgi:predicted MFS family arabinose efflux permease